MVHPTASTGTMID